MKIKAPLLVFSTGAPKQNAGSHLTPLSDTVFDSLSHGSLHFVVHGTFNNRLFQSLWLVVKEFLATRKWLKSYHGESKTESTL